MLPRTTDIFSGQCTPSQVPRVPTYDCHAVCKCLILTLAVHRLPPGAGNGSTYWAGLGEQASENPSWRHVWVGCRQTHMRWDSKQLPTYTSLSHQILPTGHKFQDGDQTLKMRPLLNMVSLWNFTGHTPMKLSLNNNTSVQYLKYSQYSKMSVVIIIFTRCSTWKLSSAQCLVKSAADSQMVGLELI